MIIGYKRQLNQIQNKAHLEIEGKEITRVHEAKYIGVTVDENLSWTAQDKQTKNKIKNGLSAIGKLKNILSSTKLDKVCRPPFESHLRYCTEV